GYCTDRKPMPMLLPLGMVFTLLGMIGLAFAPSLGVLLLASAFIGIGSSILHPESSRVAHMAAGKGKGLAQSIFQVGGNFGQALAPVIIVVLIVPLGQSSFLWFTILALIGIMVQYFVGQWYGKKAKEVAISKRSLPVETPRKAFSKSFIGCVMLILILMLF